MNNIKDIHLKIKKYFNNIINSNTYNQARKISITFRKNIIQNNYKINNNINHHEMMLFILLPIIYKYGNKYMDIPEYICQNTRSIIIDYLIHNINNTYDNNLLNIYYQQMNEFEILDKQELYNNLFINYYELLELEKYIILNKKNEIIDNIWIESINKLKKTLYKYIEIMNAVNELQIFLLNIENNTKKIIFNELDKAYWNKFKNLLNESNYEMLFTIIKDLNKLFHDIIDKTNSNIINSNYINEILDYQYIEIQIKNNLFDNIRIKEFATNIFINLKKLDSTDFEYIYDNLINKIDIMSENIPDYLTFILQNIYILIINLINKINIINNIKKN